MSFDVHARAAAKALSALAGDVDRAAQRALRTAIEATEDHARGTRLFNDRTGATRGSISGEVTGYDGRVTAGGAATWLENGTRPHEIRPRNARTLVFQANGATVFARAVHHPGTAERPFMQQARDQGEQALDYGIDEYVRQAIES